jgi:ABC-type spermidine/putrescine transport system permease subunit I
VDPLETAALAAGSLAAFIAATGSFVVHTECDCVPPP